MSSVQDAIKCPQCKGVFVTDFNCRTLEEYRHCSRCGRTEEWVIVRNEAGEPVLDENGNVKREYHENFGYGSACFAGKAGISQILSFSGPVDGEIKKLYLETLENPKVDKDKSYLTSWDDDKKEVVAIFGTVPETYEEQEKRYSESE